MRDATPIRLRVRVQGMDCPEEVAVIRKALEPMPGVQGIVADFSQGIATITVSPSGPTIDQITAAIRAGGLGAEQVDLTDTLTGTAQESWWSQHGRATLTAVSGGLIGIGIATHAATTGIGQALSNDGMPLVSRIAYGLAIVARVGPLLPRAWGALRSVRLDMNVLLVIAVCGAVGLGDWFEAATVGTLFALSSVLESWTTRRAMRAIGDLLGTRPTTARLRVTGESGECEVPVTDVPIGAVIE